MMVFKYLSQNPLGQLFLKSGLGLIPNLLSQKLCHRSPGICTVINSPTGIHASGLQTAHWETLQRELLITSLCQEHSHPNKKKKKKCLEENDESSPRRCWYLASWSHQESWPSRGRGCRCLKWETRLWHLISRNLGEVWEIENEPRVYRVHVLSSH